MKLSNRHYRKLSHKLLLLLFI